MNDLIGRWVQIKGQSYEGLWFEFHSDGTFEAQYDPMGITSSGTYEIDGDLIDMNQTEHTFGLVGVFKGRYAIEDDTLKMALSSTPGGECPEDLSNARLYAKVRN
jgi:hypothetical protein